MSDPAYDKWIVGGREIKLLKPVSCVKAAEHGKRFPLLLYVEKNHCRLGWVGSFACTFMFFSQNESNQN